MKTSAKGSKILRGGAYKPRTSPYSFQGMGPEGLIYLRKLVLVTGRHHLMPHLDLDALQALNHLHLLQQHPLDLLYICIPVQSAVCFIEMLGQAEYKKAVTDGCSTKTTILKAAKNNNLYFCGGHPIKGKETSGFTNSEQD